MATTLRDNVTAKSKLDVDQQAVRDRMWESMSNQYDQQAKQIQQGYDRAYSTADNQLLSRGMGRSSYGGQVLANISKQGVDAQTQNHNDLIAAYQNWLSGYEQQQEQFQWQKDSADRQIALSFLNNIAANGGNPSDDLLARAGLSRPDFDAMKYQAPVVSGGGSGGGRSGGGGSTRKTTNTGNDPVLGNMDDDFLAMLGGGNTNGQQGGSGGTGGTGASTSYGNMTLKNFVNQAAANGRTTEPNKFTVKNRPGGTYNPSK